MKELTFEQSVEAAIPIKAMKLSEQFLQFLGIRDSVYLFDLNNQVMSLLRVKQYSKLCDVEAKIELSQSELVLAGGMQEDVSDLLSTIYGERIKALQGDLEIFYKEYTTELN